MHVAGRNAVDPSVKVDREAAVEKRRLSIDQVDEQRPVDLVLVKAVAVDPDVVRSLVAARSMNSDLENSTEPDDALTSTA